MDIGSISTEQLLEQLKATLQLSQSVATAWYDGATLDCAIVYNIRRKEESLPLCHWRNWSAFVLLHLGLRHYSMSSQLSYSCGTRWPVGNETISVITWKTGSSIHHLTTSASETQYKCSISATRWASSFKTRSRN